MKIPKPLKKAYNILFIIWFVLISSISTAQVFKPFTPRFDQKVEGDMTIIANNIVNRQYRSIAPNTPYNRPYSNTSGDPNQANDNFDMRYIDIDNDPGTFSSSSAVLDLSNSNRSKIVYAALYWSAAYKYNTSSGSGSNTREEFDQVKLKVPGGSYIDIKGEILFDGFTDSGLKNSSPYACYADITEYVTALSNPSGTYTIANIKATQGYVAAGVSGGWTIFFIYKNPDLPNRYITSFDGFASVNDDLGYTDIPFSGFKTIDRVPVKAKLASSALEGDQSISGDRLQFKASKRPKFTDLSNGLRPSNNYFNSRITTLETEYMNREPNSRNTLGYDAAIIEINGLMDPNETDATLRLRSTQDQYQMFFGAFNVEIIEPNIKVVKTVEDIKQDPIGSDRVSPDQEVYYVLTFWNKGNDDGDNFVIEDPLPEAMLFTDNPGNLILPSGVTHTYDAATHTIKFQIPNNLVRGGSARYNIKMKMRVADCSGFRDACANRVSNQAIYSYKGIINPALISDQKSFSDFNDVITPSPTIVEVDISRCNFDDNKVELCGPDVLLEAGEGYVSYSWKDGSGKEVGTNRTYTAVATGVYTVTCQGPPGCAGMIETFTVRPHDQAAAENPLKPFADKIVKCPDTGEELAEIIICGADAEKRITTNISSGATIVWEKLDESSCTVDPRPDCPNTGAACKWNEVGRGPNFTVSQEGQYRLRITYPGNCSNRYFFNVYKNELKFDIRTTDITCGNPGAIEVTGLPGTGYEFSLDPNGPYQDTPVFPITVAGEYTVYIRQTSSGDRGCIFEKSAVIIDRSITLDITNGDAFCANSSGGSVRVQVNGGKPQYFFQLFKIEGNGSETLMRQSLPTEMDNDYTFEGLVYGGPHRINVTSENGKCEKSEFVDIIIPEELKLETDVVPITCEDGKITLKATGGIQPYRYIVNGVEVLDPVITVTSPETFTISVIDANNCTTREQKVTVEKLDKPTYNVKYTDPKCSDDKGEIRVVDIVDNGYILSYSIDGTNFQASPIFTGLSGGTYTLIVRYVYQDRITCEEIAQEITIKEVDPITASIIVVEDIACDIPDQNRAKVRITNPVGGTAPYTYSINGSAFTSNQEGYIPAGTTDAPAAVKDSNGCIFDMKITINAAPAVPDITTTSEYFCNGTATITVNTNIPNYEYEYTLVSQDGTITIGPQSSNVFTNVPVGIYTVFSKYKSPDIIGSNILLKDDFGQGKDVSSPEILGYRFIDQQSPAWTGHSLADGDYTITKRLEWPHPTWLQIPDHTGNPEGRMLTVNVGDRSGMDNLIYEKTIKDIIPKQDLHITLWGLNLFKPTHIGDADPNVTIELVSIADNKVIATQNTGDIGRTGNWNLIEMNLNPGDNDQLYLRIRTISLATEGNDLGIDDVVVDQKPIMCDYTRETAVIIDEKAVEPILVSQTGVSCFDSTDGTVTVQVTDFTPYQYSLDNGVTWVDAVLDANSRFVVDNLAPGDHTIIVRSSASSAAPCDHEIKVKIAQPEKLELIVKEQTFTGCNTARVVLEATGGSGENSYVLELPDGTKLPAQTSPVFEGLTMPGTYIATVTDKNGCPAAVTFDLALPSPIVATIDAGSDLCYTDVKDAIIVLNVSGGTAPYIYRLNGGAWSSAAPSPLEIKNLKPGAYTIEVRDDLGCTTTLTQVIGEQLKASAQLIKKLDCTANPDAVIQLTVEGGTAPFKYQVYKDGVPQGALEDLTGTTLDYKTTDTGTYHFEVTDANNCPVTTAAVVVAPLVPVSFKAVSGGIIPCHGGLEGSIIITDIIAVSQHTTEVYNTDTGTSYGNQTTGLPAGNYTVTITGSDSCSHFETVEIKENDPVEFDTEVTPLICIDGNEPDVKGKITVENVKGGTAPFTYYLTDYNGTEKDKFETDGDDYTFDILDYGIYHIKVVDSNGCWAEKRDLKVASPPDDLDITVAPATDCTAPGEATVKVAGSFIGSGPYYFAIYVPGMPLYQDDPSAYLPSNSPDGLVHSFIGLTPGVTYHFVVYDDVTKCYRYKDGPEIPSVSTLTSTIDPKNVTCKGAADGKISFTFKDYQPGVTSVLCEVYSSLSNAPTGVSYTQLVNGSGAEERVDDLGDLEPGRYYILFTELTGGVSGCRQTSDPFQIDEAAGDLIISAAVTKNANCNEQGQITVTAGSGAAPYQYFIHKDGDTPPDANVPGWQDSSVFRADGGDYIVYVKDANNCIKPAAITLLKDPSPEITAALVDACGAEGKYSIAVERVAIAGGVAPYSYSLNDGAFETKPDSFTYDNLNSGSYKITIKDGNGCQFDTTVTIDTPLELVVEIMSQPTCNTDDGAIKVKGSGGSGDYEYQLQDGSGTDIGAPQTNDEFTGLAHGDYIVVVKDIDTKCTKAYPFTLEKPSPVSFTLSSTPVSCFGATDGTIKVNLDDTNINPPYQYSSDGGTTWQNSTVFSGLAVGTYTITVKSERGCIDSKDIEVSGPKAIAIAADTIQQFGCSTGNTVDFATITIDPVDISGGDGQYTLVLTDASGAIIPSLDNTVNPVTPVRWNIIDRAGGTYTLTVSDGNNCIGTRDMVIDPFYSLISAEVKVTEKISCINGGENIAIEVMTSEDPVNPANPNDFEYSNDGGLTWQTSNAFVGLGAGIHHFEIKHKTTGCRLSITHEVIAPNDIELKFTKLNDVECFGTETGKIIFSAQSKLYTGILEWNIYKNGSATPEKSGTYKQGDSDPEVLLSAGSYKLVVKQQDLPECSKEQEFDIFDPAAALVLTLKEILNVTCDLDKGQILAEATGGWGNHQYKLENKTTGVVISDFSTKNVFSDLTPAVYEVTVKDKNKCVITETIELKAPDPITADIAADKTDLACLGDKDATITAENVTGGSGSYLYTLHYESGTAIGPQKRGVFPNMGAGKYYITITDTWNCEGKTDIIEIKEPKPILADIQVKQQLTCKIPAKLEIIVEGGTSPYEYSTDNINFLPLTPGLLLDAGVGVHTYYVTDKNHCASVPFNIEIKDIPTLNVKLDLSNDFVGCAADSEEAEILAQAEGGLGDYKYELLDDKGTVVRPAQDSGRFEDLGEGSYIVKVTSVDCEVLSEIVVIDEPKPLIIEPLQEDVTCYRGANGKITVNVTGGSGQYQYAISTDIPPRYGPGNSFDKLVAGKYTVHIQDKITGCYESVDFDIIEPTELIANEEEVIQALCTGDKGSIKISVSGGTAPYYTSLNGGPFIEGKLDFPDLEGGIIYTIDVKDAKDCQLNPRIRVMLNAPVDLQPKLTLEEVCDNNAPTNTATVSINPAIDASKVTYALDAGAYQPDGFFTGIEAGDHVIYVKHENGCIKDLKFTTDNQPVVIDDIIPENINCGGEAQGTVNITASGGTGELSYAITPNPTVFQSSPRFEKLPAGTYTVYVRDEIGCTVYGDVIITEIEAAQITVVDKQTETCYGDKDGFIEIQISGGTGPYATSINSNNPSDFLPDRVKFENLAGGVRYTIYVKDFNGCITEHPVDLPASIDLNPVATVTYNCDGNNQNSNQVTISVNPAAVNDVLYSLDKGATTQLSNTFYNLDPGTYQVTVIHTASLCNKETKPFQIVAVAPMDLSVALGGLNEIVASVSGGIAPYRYYFNDEDNGRNNIYRVKATGMYTVKVVDAVGCEIIKEIYAEFIDIDIPNFFTPNDDGHNDTWTPKNIENFPNIRTYIFDRYGREIKILKIGETWDGKYEGIALPSGDYWYVVKVNGDDDKRQFVGNVTIYR